MTRLFSLGLLSVLLVGQARAAGELAGTWRQETEGLGVSYWELTPKGEHTYEAQEYGLGGVKGTAHLKDHHLVIHWEASDGTKGVYDWHLKGTAGKGRMEYTKNEETSKFDRSSVRFIGK